MLGYHKSVITKIQDEIFKKMSVDKKVEVGVLLWKLAKSLAGEKINYGPKRSKKTPRRHC